MRVVVAVPTIPERRHRRPDVERLWTERTPDARVDVIFSEAGSTWSAGLNDIWNQIADNPPDVLIFGSDDMLPADERWLAFALEWLDQGCVPGPRVEDPRFTSWGGHPHPVADGTLSDMTAFIIIRGEWGRDVFPLPDDLHYFADNGACVLLARAGHPIRVAPWLRIIHAHAHEGRGAGFGSENIRLHIDTVRYTRWLDSLGIDREALPPAQRGHMWERRFLELGEALGA